MDMVKAIITSPTLIRAAMGKSSSFSPQFATRRRPFIMRHRRSIMHHRRPITRRRLTRDMAITGGLAFRSISGSEARIVRDCRAMQIAALCAR